MKINKFSFFTNRALSTFRSHFSTFKVYSSQTNLHNYNKRMPRTSFEELKKEIPEDVTQYKDFFKVVEEEEVLYVNSRGHTPGDIIKHIISKKKANQAFFIVDLSEILNRYKEFKAGLPNVQPYFAIKSCPDTNIIKCMGALGFGFDCASENEVLTVLSQGISPDRIIYANTIKDPVYLELAKEQGVNLMTFDNEAELYKIKKIHPKTKLIVRIKAHDSKSGNRFSTKFGCSVDEAKRFLKLAKDLDLEVVGVSFHVGGRAADAWAYEISIGEAREVFLAGQEVGMNMHLLDLGGGFPGIPERESHLPFNEIVTRINEGLDKYFKDFKDIKIIAEPGRFFATKPYCLVFNVIGKRPDPLDSAIWEYYVNDGVFGSFNRIRVTREHLPIRALDEKDGKKTKCILFGPTCDGTDVLTQSGEYIDLPLMEIGDWLFIDNFGAYTRASASNFNGFPKPECYYCYLY